ncbi:MAG: hypothetical protein RLZZ540_1953 [Bacteroidota bacterium]
MEIKSIFNFRVYLIPILIFLSFGFGVFSFIVQLIKIDFKEIWLSLIFIIVFGLIFLHEFSNKIINLKITNSNIEKRTYLGFNKTFNFKDFDGFQIRTEKGKFESYEYLYLLKDNKPIITLSQTYIKNYDELKILISNKSKNLGKSNYGFLNEILDVIRLK